MKESKENLLKENLTSKKAEAAATFFKEGYNCAQSVCLAFLDEIEAKCGLNKESLLALSSSFGGGMGRLREVCGAVSAMFIIAGILKGYTSPNDDNLKALHYELIQTLAGEFKSYHGTIICRELLNLEEKTAEISKSDSRDKVGGDNFSFIPSKRTEEYYKTRPCDAFIKTAAEIISKRLLDAE